MYVPFITYGYFLNSCVTVIAIWPYNPCFIAIALSRTSTLHVIAFALQRFVLWETNDDDDDDDRVVGGADVKERRTCLLVVVWQRNGKERDIADSAVPVHLISLCVAEATAILGLGTPTIAD